MLHQKTVLYKDVRLDVFVTVRFFKLEKLYVSEGVPFRSDRALRKHPAVVFRKGTSRRGGRCCVGKVAFGNVRSEP